MKLGTMSAISKLVTYLEEATELDYMMTNPDHPLPKLVDDVRDNFVRLELNNELREELEVEK